MRRPAIFLDRDGTLVHPRHFPSRPEELVLYDDVANRLATLKVAGFALVVITNQSGIARGLFTTEALDLMHDHLRAELEAAAARIDGIYVCPHHPHGSLTRYAIECDCRKPRPGMLQRAAYELDLDLDRSWFVGDILDDVEAGNRAGCWTVLVDLGTESRPTDPIRSPAFVGRTTVHALDIIRFMTGIGPPVDVLHVPSGWDESAGGNTASRIEPAPSLTAGAMRN